MAAWLLALAGAASLPGAWSSLLWHGHEMLFGFVATAIAGFLLTSVPVWTHTDRVAGPLLAGLVAAWFAGRVALWCADGLPGWLVASLDVAFLPLLACAVGLPIWRTGNRRNYKIVGVLLALAGANLALHAAVLRDDPPAARRCLQLALYFVLLLLVIISGRIVPLFTGNALRRRGILAPVESSAAVEWALFPALAAAIALVLLREGSLAAGLASLLCALLLGLRQARWQPHRTLDQPILWVLHVAHAWLAVGFACSAAAVLIPSFPASSAVHALSAGAIGTAVVGVMSRVTLGHTGRPLEAPPAFTAAYVLVILGAVVRVFGPLLLPGAYRGVLLCGGSIWAAGYALFAAAATPILTRPRSDGRPG
jgi:uncharacterized protein involved in response to NO